MSPVAIRQWASFLRAARHLAAAAVLSLSMPLAAQAAPIIYNFGAANTLGLGTGDLGPSIVVVGEPGLLDVTISGVGGNLTRHSSQVGLGVQGGTNDFIVNASQGIEFDFGPKVVGIHSIMFLHSGGGAFDYLVDGDLKFSAVADHLIPFVLGSFAGNVHTFVATGHAEWNFAELAVRVPEPGAAALFGVGLLALGFMRRRRSAETA